MGGKLALLLTLITASSVPFQANNLLRYKEEWVPCVPFSTWVESLFWTANQRAYVNVTVTFRNAGYNISDWGTTVIKESYDIWVDSKVWQWTSVSAQVVTTYSHTYDLGYLKEGNYTFTFAAWGYPVKSIAFDVSSILDDINGNGNCPHSRLSYGRQMLPQ